MSTALTGALRPHQDAIGQAMYAQYTTGEGVDLVERDDGLIAPAGTAGVYVAPFKNWPPGDKRAIRYARGRVLDIGCGAGRNALYLQERGHDVLGIDVSPLALKVARLRGLRDTKLLPITKVGPALGLFDTILMLGNNFGLMANERRCRWLLRRFKSITTPGARIIASSTDIYQTDDAAHLAYQRNNRRRGRMSGQIRLRIRHRQYCTPWFDYLMVSPDEMRDLLDGTGWTVTKVFQGPGALYTAVLERDTA